MRRVGLWCVASGTRHATCVARWSPKCPKISTPSVRKLRGRGRRVQPQWRRTPVEVTPPKALAHPFTDRGG
jgi:hypothetical protein